MKKFNFSLNPVLKERKIREDLQKREYAKVLKNLKREELILRDLKNEKEHLFNELFEEKSKAFPDISKVKNMEKWMMMVDLNTYKQKMIIEKTRENLHIEQKKLEEALKRKKIMERLYEKEHERYKMNIYKEEMKEIDEYNVLRRSHG